MYPPATAVAEYKVRWQEDERVGQLNCTDGAPNTLDPLVGHHEVLANNHAQDRYSVAGPNRRLSLLYADEYSFFCPKDHSKPSK